MTWRGVEHFSGNARSVYSQTHCFEIDFIPNCPFKLILVRDHKGHAIEFFDLNSLYITTRIRDGYLESSERITSEQVRTIRLDINQAF